MRRSNSIPVVLEAKIEVAEEQPLESPVRKLQHPAKPFHLQSQTSSITEGECSPKQLQRDKGDAKSGANGNTGNGSSNSNHVSGEP